MKKKILTALALIIAAAALVVVSVLGTMAYLTSSSAVSNTFTVGNVGIQMFESKVDSNGKKIDDDANINGSMKDSDGNSYHLIPGTTYDKDPTIYVDANSDSSYLFVKIRNNISTIETGNFVGEGGSATASAGEPTIRAQLEANGWRFFKATATGNVYLFVGELENNTNKKLDSVEGRHPCLVDGKNGTLAINLFETFSIHKDANISLFGGAKVTLTAFAIQTSTQFGTDYKASETIENAWQAIVDTYPYENGATVSE